MQSCWAKVRTDEPTEPMAGPGTSSRVGRRIPKPASSSCSWQLTSWTRNMTCEKCWIVMISPQVLPKHQTVFVGTSCEHYSSNGSMMIFLDGQNVSCVTNGYKCENNMNNLTFRRVQWNPSQLGTTTRPVQHVPTCSAEVPWFTSEPGPSITWLIACAGTNQHEQYENYQGQLLEM